MGPGGSERLSEEERRKAAERERSNQYKDFQGKVAQETDKVSKQGSHGVVPSISIDTVIVSLMNP